jgi:pilus assembly protein CpaE
VTAVLLGVATRAADRDARTVLGELPEFTVVGTAIGGEAIMQTAGDREPEVVLLLADDGGTALETVRDLGRLAPHVAVVLAVPDAGPAMLTEAMAVGARGLVALPLQVEEVRDRLAAAADWARGVRRVLGLGNHDVAGQERNGRTVVVAGAKGGVGTTLTAVHLALIAASEPTRRVCLVDLDLQTGDVATLLQVSNRRSIADLASVEPVTARALEETLFAPGPNLRILLAPAEGARAEEVTGAAVRRILAALRSAFDVVVVDSGSQTTDASAVVVELADQVLVLSTLDVPSLRGAQRLARLWAQIAVRREDDLLVVFNRVSRDLHIQPDTARRIVRLPTARTSVPAGFRALEASINEADPSRLEEKGVRRAFIALAGEIDIADPGWGEGNGRRGGPGERSGRRRHSRSDAGQATIEMVGVLPLIILVMLLLWQFLLVGFTWILTGNSADEAGRRLAVQDTDSGVRAAALRAVPGGWRHDAAISISRPAGSVKVTLHTPALIPGLADLPLSFSSTSSPPVERPEVAP